MPDIIQLGLSDAIAKAAKEHATLVEALPSDAASVVVNREGVTAIAGVDVTRRTTLGAWFQKKWQGAYDWGVAARVKWGRK